MKMLVSCFGTKAKHCKTIDIFKGYVDTYSDLIRNLQISLYFFKMFAITTPKMTNIYFIYQLNVIIRSDGVVKKISTNIGTLVFVKDDTLHEIPLKKSAFCLKTSYFMNK